MQVIKINNYQRDRFSRIIIDGLNGTVNQKTITLLGWAFKIQMIVGNLLQFI